LVLAAVFVAIGAYKNPAAFFDGGIISTGSMIEMSLGLAIGAITFLWISYCVSQNSKVW
jgi:NAD(P) transhydrogenase subunit beta